MKKIFSILFLTCAVSLLLSARKNIAVMPFEVVGNVLTKDEAESITELYISELVSTGKISIVDRANFDKILKEMEFQDSDWSNSEKTAKLGQAINAELIARGKIMKLGSRMYLSSTVIDITTARVVSSAKKDFKDIDEFFVILSGFVKDIIMGVAPTYNIGDTGPGGGTIFKIEIDEKAIYEIAFLPNKTDFFTAKELASNYSGGGYYDWYFPSLEELQQLNSVKYYAGDKSGYRYLVYKVGILEGEWYWCDGGGYMKVKFRFGIGSTREDYKVYSEPLHSTDEKSREYYRILGEAHHVCAIRKFLIEQ